MFWAFHFHPAVKKDLRRLSSEARNFILNDVLPAIRRDPYRGEPLRGPLKGLRKIQMGELRIAYAMDEQRYEIIIIQAGPRGGFYERLRRRLRK